VARAGVKESDEALAIARRNLEHTLVRAPYEGSIAARLADEGTTALVQPQTIVIVIQETAELEAQATIPEVHAAAIGVGDAAVLHVEGVPEPIATEVAAVSDSVDPATRTYLVRMRVPNEDRRLKAGVFARVDILPRAKSDVLLVPRSALRREDGHTYVMGVRDGRAVSVHVELGAVSEDAAEVLHGLRVDDEIVVGDAAATLGPGMRVAPARPPADEPSS
jgi:RND family efflux transporter MFP subunit